MSKPTTTIGVLGAGRVGTALARQALKAGYDVQIATARPPAEIALLVELLVPGARTVTAEAVARESDIVVLALPLGKYRTLQAEALAGRVVIDAMNYWAPTDGTIAEFEDGAASSEVVQRHLPEARLVRTLNHIGYHELEEQGLPQGHPERQALALAGDDAEARRLVAGFIDRLGFDPVDAGALANAIKFDGGTPIFGGRLRRDEMLQVLGQAPVLEQAAG
ncbi:MAG TPA: NAD(P)-binding domain-containing protein [Arsenicitalea sp.]|jgi:predicted dinucleotide-binding enzyme|nr:NAD(P)-binding domain-containing protein [Arsenicitalea sp.]